MEATEGMERMDVAVEAMEVVEVVETAKHGVGDEFGASAADAVA